MSKKQSTIEKEIETLVLVTKENEKFCIKEGRKVYVYEKGIYGYKKKGEFIIRPPLKKGYIKYMGKNVYISEDEKDYNNSFKSVINHFILKGELYIKSNEPLEKF